MEATANASSDLSERGKTYDGSSLRDNAVLDQVCTVCGVMLMIIAILSCAANGIFIHRIQQLRKNTLTATFTVGISCASAGIAVFIIFPSSLTLLEIDWWSNRVMCAVQGIVGFSALLNHDFLSLACAISIRYQTATQTKKYNCLWLIGIFVASGLLSSLTFLSNEMYAYQDSLSVCTIPTRTFSLFLVTVSWLSHLAIHIGTCTTLYHTGMWRTSSPDNQRPPSHTNQSTESPSGCLRLTGKLARKTVLSISIGSWLKFVALIFAVASVITATRWSGLLSIVLVAFACIIQPIIMLRKILPGRRNSNIVVPYFSDFSAITGNIQPRIDVNKSVEVELFQKRNNLHITSTISETDISILSALDATSKFHCSSNRKDSKSPHKSRKSRKSSMQSKISKMSNISVNRQLSWTQCTITSAGTPVSEWPPNLYQKFQSSSLRRVVSESDLTKYNS